MANLASLPSLRILIYSQVVVRRKRAVPRLLDMSQAIDILHVQPLDQEENTTNAQTVGKANPPYSSTYQTSLFQASKHPSMVLAAERMHGGGR